MYLRRFLLLHSRDSAILVDAPLQVLQSRSFREYHWFVIFISKYPLLPQSSLLLHFNLSRPPKCSPSTNAYVDWSLRVDFYDFISIQMRHIPFDFVGTKAPEFKKHRLEFFSDERLKNDPDLGSGVKFFVDGAILWGTLCSLRCEECGDVYDIASPVRRASFLSCHLVCQSCAISRFWCNLPTEDNIASGKFIIQTWYWLSR